VKKELSQLFQLTPVPDELEAQRRAWSVVREAYAEREPVRRPRRRLGPALAFALLAATIVAVAVSPVGSWLRDRVEGEQHARPALFGVPAAGRLLVLSERGPWVVQQDGSKRLLGRYENAAFSPRGLFLVVTSGRRVVAVEPDGDPRWSVTRPRPVAQARWAPSGFRVAYRTVDTLRVVDGDGTDDRLLARGVAPVAPAWRPDPAEQNVLAYADENGRVHVVDVDTRRELRRTKPGPPVRKLVWPQGWVRPLAVREGPVLDVAYSANFRALIRFDPTEERTSILVSGCPRGADCVPTERRVFTGAGRFEDLAWSPDGRWLLVTWPDADQFLFLRLEFPLRGQLALRKIVAVSGIRQEFDPGGAGHGDFPRVAGWCCVAP
jgi:hypothetical protein